MLSPAEYRLVAVTRRSRHCSGGVRLPGSVHFSGYSLSSPDIVVARPMPTQHLICACQTDTGHRSGSSKEMQHPRFQEVIVASPKQDPGDGMTVSRDIATLRSCLMSLWTSYGLRGPLSSRQPPCCELRQNIRRSHALSSRTRSRSRTWSSTAYISGL